MDLWIRSQKKGLYNLNIILPPFEDGSLWGKIDGECVLLGIYKTKEKVLEVLDDITKHIEYLHQPNIKFKYIYNMPEE